MLIKDLFDKDIDRPINGVVKVAQDDEGSLHQELSEYVVTRELSKHFARFFEEYTKAIDVPTDRIGVWISGFFGSGKSHFLKILSYLLANKDVVGKPAVDYFEGKIGDSLVYSQMKRACAVPTEAILFNIDDKASQWKEGDTAKTALLRAFARVFYEHRGFYGEDLRLARLEEFIEEQGKTAEFRTAFKRIAGGEWTDMRDDAAFYEDDIVEALVEVFGWSEQQARRPFERDTDEAMSPEELVRQIGEYVDARAAEEGGDFRLLFMVDEVGQFIGGDVNLMLNLQTIVEDLGARCRGRVWVMVTSQEAIDEVTKVASNDFSKIQGRFNLRLSLSSSSADEVIKRRVLEKTDVAAATLDIVYEKQSAVLKNLFAFEAGTRADLVGYKDAASFREAYPFADYQFNLMRDVLKQIRLHGNAGKHLSGGERSMLSGFQESAQAVEGRDVGALVPLWRFYDTLVEFLEHDIRQVIDRCARAAEDAAGIEAIDVEVLKTLYLIHYITDVKATVGNVAILMVDHMDVDKISLREQVGASLARLMRENYVSRSGDSYSFLTNEEQDIAREIKNVDIDGAAITAGIAKLLFDGIFTDKKLKVGMNDFPFDASVDGAPHGAVQGGMKLDVYTAANPYYGADDAELALQSANRAIMVLGGETDYYQLLETAERIRKYAKTKNVSQLPESTQSIIRKKQEEARAADREARDLVSRAVMGARCFVDGKAVSVRAADAKGMFSEVLKSLASTVFNRADHIGTPVRGEADIIKILKGTDDPLLMGNEKAVEDVYRFLDSQGLMHQQTSLGDVQAQFGKVPYGWREIDVSACVARLIADQRASVSRLGVTIGSDDAKLADYLTNRSEADKIKIAKREKVDEVLLSRVRRMLRDMPGIDVVPEDEDGVSACARSALANIESRCEGLLANEYARESAYPGRETVVEGKRLAEGVLAAGRDAKTLFDELIAHEDDLLDFMEDFEAVRGFFPNQQHLFDESLAIDRLMRDEAGSFAAEGDVETALNNLREVIAAPRPYDRIRELNACNETVRTAHGRALAARKADLVERLNSILESVKAYAAGKEAAQPVLAGLEQDAVARRSQVNSADTLTKLDAISMRLDAFRDDRFAAIDEAMSALEADADDPAQSPVETKAIRRSDVCPGITLRTPEEVDAYVEAIRRALLDAIDEAGSVRLTN